MTTLEGVGRRSWRGRAPLVIAGTIPVAILLTLPWSGHHLAAIPAFSAIWLSVLIVCDLLTVVLLVGQYRAGGSPRLLVLSWAYLWSSAAALEIAASVPGLLTQHPSFASSANAAQWLWLSRHVVPPLLIGLALAPWPARLEKRAIARQDRWLSVAASGVFLTLAAVVVAEVVQNASGRLPRVVEGSGMLNHSTEIVVIAMNLAAVAVAVWGVLQMRSPHGLESWAVVASVAFLGDVVLTTMDEPRFSVAYYLARTLGLAASAFVMLAIIHDSARNQARATDYAHRLEEHNAALLEAQRLREHMTAVVSHDMRTPLAGLQGYLEMLLEDDELAKPLERRMHERSWMLTRRLTLLTEDLLAVATLENGDLLLTPESLDMTAQLAECTQVFPDLDLRIDCPPGLVVQADALRLQQILANLVRNAQKHGAEPVSISARPGDGEVTVTVSDAGPGVPASFVPRLFDRYTRAVGGSASGSGLGLSVVRDLVAAHGGTIHYDPDTHGFVFTLPSPGLGTTAPAAGAVTEPARTDPSLVDLTQKGH